MHAILSSLRACCLFSKCEWATLSLARHSVVDGICLFQLPNTFKEFASSQTAGKKDPSAAFMTHCHWELLHEQWKILLDEEFLEAWTHGIVIECWDGIKQ